MQESYEILKKSIERVGAKKIAPQLGLSQSLVYKWCQRLADEESWQQGGAVNPLDRIKQIYEITQDEDLINWVCQIADGYFVKNPNIKKQNRDAEALKNIQLFIKEFSEALDAISKSYDDDKSIDAKEAIKIRKAWEGLKRVGEAFVRECEKGDFNKKLKK